MLGRNNSEDREYMPARWGALEQYNTNHLVSFQQGQKVLCVGMAEKGILFIQNGGRVKAEVESSTEK